MRLKLQTWSKCELQFENMARWNEHIPIAESVFNEVKVSHFFMRWEGDRRLYNERRQGKSEASRGLLNAAL